MAKESVEAISTFKGQLHGLTLWPSNGKEKEICGNGKYWQGILIDYRCIHSKKDQSMATMAFQAWKT